MHDDFGVLQVEYNVPLQVSRGGSRILRSHKAAPRLHCTCPRGRQASDYGFHSNLFKKTLLNAMAFWDHTAQHLPNCPQYGHTRRKDTLGVTTASGVRILGGTITFALFMQREAGRTTFGPQLTFRAVVPFSSPVFQLLGYQSGRQNTKFSSSYDHAKWIWNSSEAFSTQRRHIQPMYCPMGELCCT